MRFFDAHCDTIGPLLERGAHFLTPPEDRAAAAARGDLVPHVTLPGLQAGGVGAQVFAGWVWSGRYPGREFETGMAKVEAVRRLCADHPDALFLPESADELNRVFARPRGEAARLGDRAAGEGGERRIAVLLSIEGADSLAGDVANIHPFRQAGVRLLTLAWGDTAFSGSAYGDGGGLTKKGVDLVAACESLGILIDVSHLSDEGFADVCRVAERPFVASHSNCRSLCPSGRNLTDEMVRSLGERGGVMGIALAPGFLSQEYWEKDQAGDPGWYGAILSGQASFEDVRARETASLAAIPLPPLTTVVDHVKWAIDKGGEDVVGLGGDLDGVDFLPAGFTGVEDYPKIERSLRAAGLSERQVEKVCYGNFLRVFGEALG